MTAPRAAAQPPFETVLPDYCNAGVIFRVLFAVNALVVLVSLVHAPNWLAGLLNFVESTILVEWACLGSIFVLCGVRRLLLRTGLLRALSIWSQRLVSVLVPAIVTGVIIHFLARLDWFRFSFSYLSVHEGMAVAALLAGAAQHYFELRARAFSPALVEARLQALQARIRPHFLFNSLNAVLSLIRKEPMRAETALEDLAELFRVSMRDMRDMTSLDEEIRLCRQYLFIEQIRLGERLLVQWDTDNITDEELRTAQIATLMLQPLLENAVNYGVEPNPAPTQIDVKIASSLGTITITVVNPLAPNADMAALSSGRNRMALVNIRERLELLYDVEAQLITETVDGKFSARLQFPLSRRAA